MTIIIVTEYHEMSQNTNNNNKVKINDCCKPAGENGPQMHPLVSEYVFWC